MAAAPGMPAMAASHQLPRHRAYAEICRCARHSLPCPSALARWNSASLVEWWRCAAPKELNHILKRAGGVWEPGSRRWLVDRRRIGPVMRALEAATDPLFRRAGLDLDHD
jgi:hypothetical protein